MLRGDLTDAELEAYVEERVLTTTLDKVTAWAQGNSMFPATFGLACCAIEMMSMPGARLDIGRFGFEAFRASPRQADMLILSGRVSIKMAPIVRRIYDQMLEPRWAISMGACCSSMGVFNNYAIVPADKFMPIDVHVPAARRARRRSRTRSSKLRSKVQGNPPERLARALRGGRHRRGRRRRPTAPASTRSTSSSRGDPRCLTRPVSS